MNIFAIGDLHLSFVSQKPMDIFSSQWTDHTAQMESAWLKKVTVQDVILIPGDISWAMRQDEAKTDLLWLDRLPGRKVCIRGNHDYWWDRPGKLNKAYEHITFLQNDAYCIGDLAICGTRGWDCTMPEDSTEVALEQQKRMIQRECKRLELSLKAAMKKGAADIWVMLHYPPAASGLLDSPFIQLMRQYPVTKVIYGHLHDPLSWQSALQGESEGISYHLVSADYLSFEPKWLGEL